jgi:hypothetical protein
MSGPQTDFNLWSLLTADGSNVSGGAAPGTRERGTSGRCRRSGPCVDRCHACSSCRMNCSIPPLLRENTLAIGTGEADAWNLDCRRST